MSLELRQKIWKGTPSHVSSATVRRENEQQQLDEKEKRVYEAWVNWKLSGAGPSARRVNDVVEDLADGVALCQLAQVLLNVKLRFNANPTLKPQMVDNCSVALNALRNVYDKITIQPHSIVDKDSRLILGFLWQLVESEMTFATIVLNTATATPVKPEKAVLTSAGTTGVAVAIDDNSNNNNNNNETPVVTFTAASGDNTTSSNVPKRSASKEAFHNSKLETYKWVSDFLKDYPGVPKEVGGKSFRDGRLLCFLLHRMRPDAVDLTEVELKTPFDRLLDATKGAQKYCGIPALVSPEALMDESGSENALLTYLFAIRLNAERALRGQTPRTDSEGGSGGGSGVVAAAATPVPEAPKPPKPMELRTGSPLRPSPSKGKFGTIRGGMSEESGTTLQPVTAGPQHAGILCQNCAQPLSGMLVRVMPDEVLYHNKCFCCRTCKKGFDQFYWPFQMVPYCFDHYIEAAGLTCHTCKKPIRQNPVIARGHRYHIDCFTCTTCHKPFKNSFNLFDGKPYCDEDYVKLAGVTCTHCGLPLAEGTVRALGGAYHKGCFCCRRCDRPILQDDGTARPFYSMNDECVCRDCHDAMVGYTVNDCAGCGKLIESESTSAMNAKWHAECFCCSACKKPIRTAYYNVGNKPYDEACARLL